jgi:hypothetical protein
MEVISRFELINSVYAISKEKARACRALKLVDPKATATTKEGSVNRIFKDTNLPSYNWSNLETNKELRLALY